MHSRLEARQWYCCEEGSIDKQSVGQPCQESLVPRKSYHYHRSQLFTRTTGYTGIYLSSRQNPWGQGP